MTSTTLTPELFHTTRIGLNIPLYLIDIDGEEGEDFSLMIADDLTRVNSMGADLFFIDGIPRNIGTFMACSVAFWNALTEEERAVALLHEEGHFILGHLNIRRHEVSEEDLDNYECEADAYAAKHYGQDVYRITGSAMLRMIGRIAASHRVPAATILDTFQRETPKRYASLGL